MGFVKYKIVALKRDAASTKIFTLRPLENGLTFMAGQFIMLHLLDSGGESIDKRPYSIASSPFSDELELCIKIVPCGRFTPKLDAIKKGAVVGVEGPFGSFYYPAPGNITGKSLVFIAGGAGVVPFVSMLRYIDESKSCCNTTLYYSARTEDSLIYKKELGQLAKNQNIRVVFTLTREESEAWNGERGRVTVDMLKKYLVTDVSECTFYICGPLKMAMDIRSSLEAAGVRKENIFFEGWG